MSKYRAEGHARIILDPKVRAYVYGVSIPVMLLLVGLGVVTNGTAGMILDVVAAVLGVGTSALAVANTPPRDDAEDRTPRRHDRPPLRDPEREGGRA